MKNKTIVIQALAIALAIIAIVCELAGFMTDRHFAETPKQFLVAVLLCWLVFSLFSKQQDDDDWAGQY